ncbi:helix-turn-helix domain-containing protein [Actinoplanes awajinensis]|uniref:Excisionase n=1 Tax=Actinoplanes awajinensis subsp. mycoplanecinus TaxID=135947 RepID=A0A0X3V8M7_9ACTN|nr:helix-turn-helix domain-containing protein [Actinoplanes awajinensis]KUL40767.1 excisionase [Actinoplanes awajinensis subsp. mycoplanecinus]
MAPPVDEPRWTVNDVAAYLHVERGTVYTWRKRHYGPPAARVGKHLRYDPDEVRAWFRDRRAA